MILSGVRPAAMLAVAGAAAAAIAQPAAQPAAGPSDEQACEFRYTEITLNALSGPASREVSEDELAWARQQEERKARGEPCALPEDTAAAFREATALNAAFEAGTRLALSPQTTGERLICAAVWNRWNYAVESAPGEELRQTLRRELSAAYAADREAFWRKRAGKASKRADDRAEAEEKADDLYAAYANGEERGADRLMEWLAICR
ncbi:hypothetical protein ABC955_15410 [Citromicrobium bathyomarinum]|uniref:hypothetical protein n=1 Tax=unclassified Citromicrobium TaxID=2630544 RepID=UPI0006C8F20F|nr:MULTISPECIES: hypothetical protein [unclassified Citromicrobium]MAO04507.1 hypothetical protein [Citromicrobium sp.]OAM10426.1 hypothetical protein A0U43_05090 [Citromicrobium sp. RCC1897]|tara:strand:- start:1595 stop:2212 length:618 start_codon:yes stop_codon:yes gene_type:complete